MTFVKEYRSIMDEFPEWEYLNSIGVRDMFGDPINDRTTELVVDRENNYFLIPRGRTNINRDNEEIVFFALCINNRVINIEVEEKRSGSIWDNSFECHWVVKKVNFPEGELIDFIDEESLKKIIIEAFMTKTFSTTFTPERTRVVTVDFKVEMKRKNGIY